MTKVVIGILLGGSFALLLLAFDLVFQRFSLKSFNVTIVGLFSGYLMGKALTLIFSAIVTISTLSTAMSSSTIEITKIALFLFGTYLGTVLTLRYAEEIHISLPFIKLSHTVHKKKDLLLDISLLSDGRIIDFSSSGLLDNQLVLPRFILKALNIQAESSDEMTKMRAKKTLENIKKLESISHLHLRYHETDFPEVQDLHQKMTRLAKLIDANIFSADTNRMNASSNDEVTFINIHNLSNSLKPLTPPGETITIKVQRYGKEPKQGVGYLDDGTMVVINNGGDYIGEVIETQVISIKQTSAGRIIFTNALVEEFNYNSDHTYHQQAIYEHQHD